LKSVFALMVIATAKRFAAGEASRGLFWVALIVSATWSGLALGESDDGLRLFLSGALVLLASLLGTRALRLRDLDSWEA